MQILTDISTVKPQPACLTIGLFDGVHRGHRYLIDQSSSAARRQGLQAVLLTFYPHPSVVLRGAQPFHLSTREDKLALLSALDLDLIVIEPFTPGLGQTRANQYVDRLIDNIGMVELWVGPDFALGYRREGDVDFLRHMGDRRGFAVNIVNRLKLDGAPISSSRTRQALREGNVTLAARCLGRPYRLQGPVVIGDQRGCTLGFPTANLAVSAEQAVPAHGVYAGWARLPGGPVTGSDISDPSHDKLGANALPPVQSAATDRLLAQRGAYKTAELKGMVDEQHRAVINIGTRPTFDNGARTIEAHLIDFDHNIYGQQLILDFVAHLRPEQRFNGVEALVAQIKRDLEQARQLLHRA